MSSLEELRRARIAARGWLKRAVVKLEQVSQTKGDLLEYECALAELDARFTSVDSIQEKIELLLDESLIDEDVSKAAEVREHAVKCRVAALRACKALKGGAAEQEGGSMASQAVRLPRLELPKFGGSVLEWEPFWDQFSASVDCSELPEVSKLVYLKSLLVGEARKVVEGLAMVAGNYKVACDLLKERFARPALIIFAHVDRLLRLGVRDHKDLKSIQDELLLHVRSLERLGIGGDTYGVILTPLVLSRLPEAFRMEWARDCAGRESDLDYLLESLKREIERKDPRSLPELVAVAQRRRPDLPRGGELATLLLHQLFTPLRDLRLHHRDHLLRDLPPSVASVMGQSLTKQLSVIV